VCMCAVCAMCYVLCVCVHHAIELSFSSYLFRNAKPSDLLQPRDVGDAVVTVCTPRAACFTEVQLEPQADLTRQEIFIEVPALSVWYDQRVC
jgi:hypothetical protein